MENSVSQQPDAIPTSSEQPRAKSLPTIPKKTKKPYILTTIFIVLLGVILFTPIPYYVKDVKYISCPLSTNETGLIPCPKTEKTGWSVKKSLFQRMMYYAFNTSRIVSSQNTITLIPTIKPITSWNTYTNETFRFSFRYPDLLIINNEQDYARQNGNDKTLLFGLELNNKKAQVIDTLYIYTLGTQSITEWISENINTNKRLPRKVDITSQQQLQIGSLSVHEIIYSYGAIYVFSNNDKRAFLLTTPGSKDATQFLSTFEFFGNDTVDSRISCLYKGKTYKERDTVPSGDNCNTCSCNNGQVSCTLMACSPTRYTCPSNGWVDCMPGTIAKPECSQEAMSWYQINCPDFKGAAL